MTVVAKRTAVRLKELLDQVFVSFHYSRQSASRNGQSALVILFVRGIFVYYVTRFHGCSVP